jgi:hypothetical protein
MKKGWTVLALTVVISGLSACGANNAADNRNDTGLQTRKVRVNNVNNVNNVNTGLNVSTRASRNVERLNEVDRAHVIISNNNAYVAVRLANNGINNNTNVPRTGAGITGTGSTSGINGTTGTGVSGSGTGIGNGWGTTGTGTTGVGTNRPNISGTNTNTGIVPPTGTSTGTNNLGYNNTGGTTTMNRDDVNRAGVLDTNRNNTTINGTNGTTYSKVDTALEKRIANQVRATDKNINKVYVSVNNDFYNRMNTYSNDIRSGNNRDGVLRDFNNTVRGMFNR